ncbi:unnamed protein product [Mesocestoides corti]|uniref:Protein-tyrosine-phosphatase n=2 Tax=Mesocestoides corti TaxID=53468 RepID=A0A158QSS7_MESCO|nr:unnamed protein product [Mesocestoides corti]
MIRGIVRILGGLKASLFFQQNTFPVNNFSGKIKLSFHERFCVKADSGALEYTSAAKSPRKRRSLSAPVDFSHLAPPRMTPDLPPLLRFFDHTGAQVRCQATGNPRPTVKWLVATNLNGNANNATSPASLELGFSAFAREAQNVDSRLRGADADDYDLYDPESRGLVPITALAPPVMYPNQYVVDDGWLNFTATPRSSTLRMVFFCQAENTLGKSRSRKMVIHQVPVPDENLRIKYHSFPIKSGQKAVIRCQPEQEIFNRFLKVKYWEVFRNETLIATVAHSKDRYSVINATRYPELHIRDVTEADLAELHVRCVLQSIVDESREIRRQETGRLQPFGIFFQYEEVRSQSTDVDVLVGSTVELPWAVESYQSLRVQWYWYPASSPQQKFHLNPEDGKKVHSRPWGSKYEFVQGAYGNLRLINVSLEDAGQYSCEAAYPARLPPVVYTLKIRAPIEVRITPQERVCDFGTRVELECLVSGYPHQIIYWLHNAQPLLATSGRHSVQRRDATAAQTVRERLVINSFSLEDSGVYQCVAESSLSDSDSTTTSKTSQSSSAKSAVMSENADDGRVSVGDLVDNAQDTAHLVMGKMKPMRTAQSPAAAEPYATSQVLLSRRRGELNVTLECRFAANPLPSIDWFRDDLPLSPDDKGVVTSVVQKDRDRAYSVPLWDELWQYGGEYRAVANNSLGYADCRTFLLLDTPLRLRPVDSSKPAIAGRFHDLKCYFIGSGIPKLQWHRIKDGRRVERIPVDHRHALLENARVLRITEVNKEEDEADYRCTAMLGDMADNITITLKVSRAPRIQDLPEVQRVQGGRQSLTYSCATQNHADRPWYAWWRFQPEGSEGAYAADLHQADRRALSEALRRQLPQFVYARPNSVAHVRIEQLNKRQHQGTLTCKIMNEVGFDERPIRVTFIPELEFEIRPPNKQDVTLAQNISINCTARPSELAPIIVWKYSDESTGDFKTLESLAERTEGRIYQEENGTLVISRVEESDPRKFLCFLTPKESTTATPISVAVNLEIHANYAVQLPDAFIIITTTTTTAAATTTTISIIVIIIISSSIPARIEPLKNVDQVRGSKFNLTCVVHGDGNDLQANWYHRVSSGHPWRLINQTCVLPASYGDADSQALSLTPSDVASDPLACQKFAAGRFDSGVVFRQVVIESLFPGGTRKKLVSDIPVFAKLLRCGDFPAIRAGEKITGRDADLISLRYVRELCRVLAQVKRFDEDQRGASTVRLGLHKRLGVGVGEDRYADVCIARAPLLTLTFLPQVSTLKQSGRGIERQLQFDSLKDVHMGDYMCNASNFYNRDEDGRRVDVREILRLTVISIPDPVTFVQNSSQTTATSVSFSWLPPAHNGNKEIRRYWIRYYQADSSASEFTSTQSKPSNVIEFRAHERQATLTGLRPYTKYNIAIKAENEVGFSLENSLVLTTQEAKPDGPVQQLNASGVASDTIYVAWQKPKPELRNGNVDRYSVCHQRVNESLTGNGQEDLARLPWPTDLITEDASVGSGLSQIHCAIMYRQQDTELVGLPKFTAYAIRVIAINSKGQSPPAYALARTLEDLPQAPPTNVTCFTQQHSITVSWDPPNFETVNGILTEYLVNYYIANDFGDETNSVIQVVKGQTTVTLAGLLANTKYIIQVAASNRKGRGPLSPKKACVTTEAPPEAPENIKALPVNDSCVIVSWSHPIRPQGLTRLYCLAAYRQDNMYRSPGGIMSAGPRCIKPDFTKPYNYYLFCDLNPHYLYNISVMAKNRFDGRKAYVSSIAPSSHPAVSIISIGGTIVAQEKMRVLMDCLVDGHPPVAWISSPHGMPKDVQHLDNGTLIIEAVEPRHTGRYVCRHQDDSISYELKVQEPPKPPVFHKLTPSLRNIQVEWLSPGSRRLDAPIKWFHLNWTNEYTGLSDSVRLSADRRTYYLSNLTCATSVRFQIRAENKFGLSPLTDPISTSTDGSAPLFIGETDMVPADLRSQTSVTFNFSVFAPGHNCSPTAYRFRIWPASEGPNSINGAGIPGSGGSSGIGAVAPLPLHLNATLTKRDLFTLDSKWTWNRRCCYNVSGLLPGSYYQYHVIAENPAGKTPHFGYFWTRTVAGVQPREGSSNRLGRTSFLSQPTIIVPLTIFFVVLFMALVCIFFYCRHRRLEGELNQPTKPTVGRPVLATDGHAARAAGETLHQKYAPGRHRGTLPPIPVNEKPDYPLDKGPGGFLGRWGRGSRVYDRGRGGPAVPSQAPAVPIEPDRLSTSSMDSTGNLNPYATYAAGGIEEDPQPVSKASNTVQPTSTRAARAITAARTLDSQPRTSNGARLYKAFNKGFPLERQHSYMHQYHYPDLANPEVEGLLEATRRGGGRFMHIGDPRTMRGVNSRRFQHHALLDPPLHQPYVNNSTMDDEDDDDDDIDFVGHPHQLVAHRRTNSFESLQQHIFRHGVFPSGPHLSTTTYHRGYARARGAPRTTSGGNGVGPSFYDTRNSHLTLDPLTAAYRGSVLSSTTVSSNQDELMQAYEYGRKHGRFLTGANAPQTAAVATAVVPSSTLEPVATSSAPAVSGAVVVVTDPHVGGSGSSEATDPGICQFTQQPPRPEEIESRLPNGAIDPTAARCGGARLVSGGARGGPLNGASIMADDSLPPAFLKRQLSECPSEMTDTYASVDYSAAAAGSHYAATQQQQQQQAASAASYRSMANPTRAKLPTIPQNQQLLAARIEYPDLESDSGMSGLTRGPTEPGFHRQSSQHSYYYPTPAAGYYGQKSSSRQQGPNTMVRRQDSLGSGVQAAVFSRTQPRQNQQQDYLPRTSVVKVNPRQLAGTRSNGVRTLAAEPPIPGYGSNHRTVVFEAVDGPSTSTSNYGTPGRPQPPPSQQTTTGPVEQAEDEENIYTSEFVLV